MENLNLLIAAFENQLNGSKFIKDEENSCSYCEMYHTYVEGQEYVATKFTIDEDPMYCIMGPNPGKKYMKQHYSKNINTLISKINKVI